MPTSNKTKFYWDSNRFHVYSWFTDWINLHSGCGSQKGWFQLKLLGCSPNTWSRHCSHMIINHKISPIRRPWIEPPNLPLTNLAARSGCQNPACCKTWGFSHLPKSAHNSRFSHAVRGTPMPRLVRQTISAGSRCSTARLRMYFSQAPWSWRVPDTPNVHSANGKSQKIDRTFNPCQVAKLVARGWIYWESFGLI